MKKKLVILSLTVISINSLCSELKSACCAEDEEHSVFDNLLKEEKEAELLTLLRLNYAESFLNPALSPREQQKLIAAGIQFLKKTLDEIAKKPNEHHAYLNKMFGKQETTENLIRLYQQLLERELIREAELKEALEIAKATSAITQEQYILAQKAESEKIALDRRKAEIKAALERARSETQKRSDSLPPKELTTSMTTLPNEGQSDTQRLLRALDTLANKSDIRTATDFSGPGFCPACGPHTDAPHRSYRHNGQKISLKGIASLEDLDAFIKKDLRDSRRKIIAKIIQTLGQEYFSNQKIKKDLETIFSHSWTH